MSADHIQMFTLGSLEEGEAHGYQLLARARMWGVDEWAGFSAGSIYNALSTLEKRGLVVRAGTAQQGGYAPATVYAITDAGRAHFRELLRKTAATALARDPFDLVTPFIGLLSPEDRLALVEARLARVRRRRDEVRAQRDHIERHVAEGMQLDWALAVVEKADTLLDTAVRSAEELLVRSQSWGAPDPLPRTLPGRVSKSHRSGDVPGAACLPHPASDHDESPAKESD